MRRRRKRRDLTCEGHQGGGALHLPPGGVGAAGAGVLLQGVQHLPLPHLDGHLPVGAAARLLHPLLLRGRGHGLAVTPEGHLGWGGEVRCEVR